MADNIPTHHSSEKNKGMLVVAGGVAASLPLLATTVQFGPLVGLLSGSDFDASTWEKVGNYMGGLYNPKAIVDYYRYSWGQWPAATAAGGLISMAIGVAPAIAAAAINPFRMFDLIHGDARLGNKRDVREMEKRAQVGIIGADKLVLGNWPKTEDRMALIETLSVLVLAPPGTGKSLAPHEPVLMYDGTVKRTGDLVVGDLLMGPDGTPRRVTNTCPGYGPMYRITPTKGKSFECNGDHILSLRCSKTPRNRSVQPVRGQICHVTVEQWLDWSQEQKGKWKQWRAAVDFPQRETPLLDPYVMGAMLGDGTLHHGFMLTCEEPEVLEALEKASADHDVDAIRSFASNGTTPRLRYSKTSGVKNPVTEIVRSYGMATHGRDKHIHLDYKAGSRETRLQLLAGYLDTDGSYDVRCNVFDVVSASRQLIDDIAFIARSLGFAAYPTPCEKTCTNNNVTGLYHRLCISGDLDRIPTRVARKQAAPRRQIKDVTNVGFKIEPIGDGEYFGIIVDGDHQYLLDDFTVTHNTASFVVPSIIETDNSSFIVNDPKPELFEACSGHRAEIGHVFMINWSATDKVDPDNLDDPTKTIFYPRFNVLSPQLTPPAGTAERDTYLDAIANVLSPGGDKGGKNDYFEQKGRAALVGFLHYICSKVNDARDYDGLPEFWRGKEACIPMIVDMVNEGLRRAAAENDRKKEEAAAAQSFYQGDAMSDWLKAIVGECEEKQYNPRASTEITPLISMAPNERSGILGTMDKAFIPFKNAAVRERTMSCDFLPSDLRGMPDPETGEMKPVTLFVCVNQAEAAAFATITSLLYEVFSREFLAYGPKQVNRNNVKLGPFPVCFMLDEFAKLPRIEAVMTGPDLGRSKATYYCLVAQSAAQIGKLYSKEDQEIIYATTAVKYVLPQNDKDTVQLICSMVGPTTIRKSSRSKTRGADFKEWGKSNESIGLEKVDLIRPGDIAGMKPGTHMLICQGFMNRPFIMDSVFWFKNKEMAAKVYNPRNGQGPQPSQPLPPHIRARRIEEWKKNNGHFQPKTVAPQPRRSTDLDPDEPMAA